MKPVKINVNLVDKDKIFKLKGRYDPETRIVTAKRRVFDKTPLKFEVDPSHIYLERKRMVCYVDNASRRSIKIGSDDPIDSKKSTTLNFLIDQAFWKAVLEKRKISAVTALALLLAGVGLYTFLVTILRAAGFNV